MERRTHSPGLGRFWLGPTLEPDISSPRPLFDEFRIFERDALFLSTEGFPNGFHCRSRGFVKTQSRGHSYRPLLGDRKRCVCSCLSQIAFVEIVRFCVPISFRRRCLVPHSSSRF